MAEQGEAKRLTENEAKEILAKLEILIEDEGMPWDLSFAPYWHKRYQELKKSGWQLVINLAIRKSRWKEVIEMTEVKMLTAKQLAEKAGVNPAELRKLLRKEFNRAGKTKVEGNRMEYRFAASDPIVKQIMEKARGESTNQTKAKSETEI
jgi:hypothetical protein